MYGKDNVVLCFMFYVLCAGFISVTCFPVTGCLSQTAGKNVTVDTRNGTAETPQWGVSVKEDLAKDPYSWNFGKVEEGKVLTHEFIFKNETKAIVNIKDVNTSCGCTLSNIKKKKLLPGESTIIGVQFDSTGYSGEVTQHIFVNTDDLDNPIIRYIIKADVVK